MQFDVVMDQRAMLEDTRTAFTPIIPWSNISIFIMGTLGVSFFEYVTYAPSHIWGWSLRQSTSSQDLQCLILMG